MAGVRAGHPVEPALLLSATDAGEQRKSQDVEQVAKRDLES